MNFAQIYFSRYIFCEAPITDTDRHPEIRGLTEGSSHATRGIDHEGVFYRVITVDAAIPLKWKMLLTQR